MTREERSVIQNNKLLRNLGETELDTLLGRSTVKNLAEGEFLAHEGDPSEHFYIVLRGKMAVFKREVDSERVHQVNEVGPGESLGEMALIDNARRSASMKATDATRLLAIPVRELQALVEEKHEYFPVFRSVSDVVAQRLRYMNEVTVAGLERQSAIQKLQLAMSNFFLNVIVFLCIFSFVLTWLSDLYQITPTGSYVTVPVMIILVVMFCVAVPRIMQMTGFTAATFGLTLMNWRRSVRESILFTVPVLGLITLLKYLLIVAVPRHEDLKLFDPLAGVRVDPESGESALLIWFATALVYALVVVPIQELIARGALQGALEQFLAYKRKSLVAILISNLLFATAHLFMSPMIALLTLVPGLYFGWLYARHRTLVGPCIAHFLVGFWALSVLGLESTIMQI